MEKETKFAYIKLSQTYNEFLPELNERKISNDQFRDNYVFEELPIQVEDKKIMSVNGYVATLPLVKNDFKRNIDFFDAVYTDCLELLKERGVCVIIDLEPINYCYNNILPNITGLKILPFLVPNILKRLSKLRNTALSKMEVIIIDEDLQLTLDLLCIIATKINYLTVYTKNSDAVKFAAEQVYNNVGLSIRLTSDEFDHTFETADFIIGTTNYPPKGLKNAKDGAIFFNLSNNNNVEYKNFLKQNADYIDGVKLKIDRYFISNKEFELFLFMQLLPFQRYISGRFNDNDFYNILENVQSFNPKISMFLRQEKDCNIFDVKPLKF